MHILIVLLVGIGVITLIQLWVPFISWDIYLKLIILYKIGNTKQRV